MKLLFIGGCCDGQWNYIHPDQDRIEGVSPIKIDAASMALPMSIKSDFYEKESFRGEYQTFHVKV